MARLEQTLLDRYLARALDYSGKPWTKDKLIQRCEQHIEMYGRQAKTGLHMKGIVGMGLKSGRRLFPTGPLGHVEYGTSGGLLSVEFPSLELLDALDGYMSVSKHSALARYYISKSEPAYPEVLLLPLAIQMAQDITEDVVIAEDVVEAVFYYERFPLASTFGFAMDILRVEDEARKRRWKRVDLPRWEAAGLNWPVLRIKRRSSTKSPPPPLRFHCVLTPDEKNLLDNYRNSPPDARAAIKAASDAFAPPAKVSSKPSVAVSPPFCAPKGDEP